MGEFDDKYRKDMILGMVADLAFQLNKQSPLNLETMLNTGIVTKKEMTEVFEEQLDVLFPQS